MFKKYLAAITSLGLVTGAGLTLTACNDNTAQELPNDKDDNTTNEDWAEFNELIKNLKEYSKFYNGLSWEIKTSYDFYALGIELTNFEAWLYVKTFDKWDDLFGFLNYHPTNIEAI